MKKYIVFVMVLGLLALGAPTQKAHAITLNDLQAQIKALTTQINSLSSQLTGAVVSATSKTKATDSTAPCLKTSAPSITVLSPNGGEVYQMGQAFTARWSLCNIPPITGQISIVLKDTIDTTQLITLGTGQAGDGSVYLAFPNSSSWAMGNRYKIMARWQNPANNQWVQDLSDNVFTINPLFMQSALTVTPVATNVRSWTIGQEPSNTQLGMFNVIVKIKNNSTTSVLIPTTSSPISWLGQVSIEPSVMGGSFGYGLTDLLTSDAAIGTPDGYNYILLSGQEKTFSYTADVSVSPSSMARMKMSGILYKYQSDPTYSVKTITPPIYTSYVQISS